VDSEQLNNFDAADQKYLEAIVELIRKRHFA
jgi:putative methionine-R-sulfoxide reductase with GAF domain